MPPTGSTQSKTFLPWGIAAIVLVAAVFGYRYFTREKVEVRTAQVTRQSLTSNVSTNGKVEPVEGSEFQAHAPTPGIIKKIYVDVGDEVKPGTLLISLDDTDLVARIATASSTLKTMQSNAQDLAQGGTTDERIAMSGDLDRARNQQTQAAHDLAAIQSLQQRGAASANEVASAQQRLQVAESNIRSLQQRSTGRYGEADRTRSAAQIAEAKANLAAAQSAYASANIRSPIAGTVYAVPVSPYDFVPAGDDLLDVADLDRIQIRAYFDEPEIGRLQQNQPVSIVWEAKPGQKWHGHIQRAPTTVITYGTRNVGECIISVDDAHGDLPPNSNVTVTVTTSERHNVLSLPREALHTDAGDYVYRIVNGKLQRTPIVIGATNLIRFEVVSGLNEKDVVALNSTANRDLTNGLEVRAVQER